MLTDTHDLSHALRQCSLAFALPTVPAPGFTLIDRTAALKTE